MIEIQQLSKSFGSQKVLDELSFSVEEGQVFGIRGCSGCGKTTLLRIIAGLDRPDKGSIFIDGKAVVGGRFPFHFISPEKRGIGMVFQDAALFPHLTVEKNIAFGLRGSKKLKGTRVGELLELVGLESKLKRYPHQLSGGERQRIGLARALAPNPRVLLLDEPFSALNLELRDQVMEGFALALKSTGTTAIVVSHRMEELSYLAQHTLHLGGNDQGACRPRLLTQLATG